MDQMMQAAKALTPALIELRRAFHERPEISGHEIETSKKVAAELRAIGYEVQEHVGGNGVLATLCGSKPGKTIALRADMDALQIKEMTGLPFCSKNEGVMHACGHDAHMTFLLGAARLLYGYREKLSGSVRLIFQPAEELSPVGGSREMIRAGALEGVDEVYGLHVWPDLPHGKIGLKSGPLMAASDHFTVTLRGKSSHAAKPNDGIDAIVMGSQYVQAIQSIISRETNPMESAVITIGKFQAGTRYNILAESCVVEGTCRTLNEKVRDDIEEKLERIMQGVCMMHGSTGDYSYERGYMAVLNHEQSVEQVRKSAASLYGEESVEHILLPSMCAEDFAFYLKEKPGAFFWLGTGREGNAYPLHNSLFDVDEEILWRGTALLTKIALDVLGT